MHGDEYINDFKYIYIFFVTYLVMMEYDTCGIRSDMFRGGGMVHPCRQMFRGGSVVHPCRQMFRGGSVVHPCRQMFRGGVVVHICRQMFRGGGVVHTCRHNQLDDQIR